MNRLFPELLVHIFELCCTPASLQFSENNVKHDSLHLRFAPWVISHVSKDWRQIAHSTSLLWSTIILSESFARLESQGSQATENQATGIEVLRDRLRTQLVHSGDHGLDIRFDLGGVGERLSCEFEEEAHGTFMRLISEHHERWRLVRVVDLSEDAELLWNWRSCFSPTTFFPRLETLILEANIILFFDGSYPRLTSLHLDGPFSPYNFPFSLAQLHNLYLEEHRAKLLPPILAQAISLQSLTIRQCVIHPSRPGEPTLQPYTLPDLKSLELDCWCSDVDKLIAPSLRTLSLRSFAEEDLERGAQKGLFSFLQHSGRNITEFRCSNFSCDAGSTGIQLLSHLPKVEKLIVRCDTSQDQLRPFDLHAPWHALERENLSDHAPATKRFLQDLTKYVLARRNADGAFLVYPHLRHLSLEVHCHGCDFEDTDKAGFIATLEERISGVGGAVLESVSLRFHEDDSWNVDLMGRLLLLAQRGLRVEGHWTKTGLKFDNMVGEYTLG